jgi:hypothetical protein
VKIHEDLAPARSSLDLAVVLAISRERVVRPLKW